MALLSFLVLLSAVQLIVAPPSMLLPNSTTLSASWNGASNMSASTLAQIPTSTSPDQQEFIDLGYNFKNLNKSLSLYCMHVQESAYLSWKTTNTQTTSFLTCRQSVTGGHCENAGTYTKTYVPEFTPTMNPPCCGQCVITASRAYAVFWPTPAPQPNISTLVGADGFTYTSPSVYVIYDHLGATDGCGHPGSVMSNATVPLQPWQVSSFGLDSIETQVNFAKLTNCSTKASGVITNDLGAYDPCHPSLQYDISYLSTIQPEWATCVDVGGILYDPPSALTSASALTGPDPQVTSPEAALPSSTHSATPEPHLPHTPPMTDPQIDPPMPKQTPTDPSGRVSRTESSQETLSEPTIQSSAGLPDSFDPNTKPKDASAAGQGSNGLTSDPENTTTESTTPTSQASAVVMANTLGTPTISSPDASQANDSGKDLFGDPSDPSNPSPPQPLVIGDQKITIPNSGATALKVGSQTLNPQTPVLTISNTPISLASDKIQIGTSIYSFKNPTPPAAGNVFTIGPESFTLDPQGITVDGTQIKVGGPTVTVDGTRVYLGPSEFIVGDKTETFALATRDPLVEANGNKGEVGVGNAAGSEPNVTPSAGADAGIGSALMSGLGAVGGGAATQSDSPGSSMNVSSVAPFLGTASKIYDNVDLWVSVGSGLLMFVCLMM